MINYADSSYGRIRLHRICGFHAFCIIRSIYFFMNTIKYLFDMISNKPCKRNSNKTTSMLCHLSAVNRIM